MKKSLHAAVKVLIIAACGLFVAEKVKKQNSKTRKDDSNEESK